MVRDIIRELIAIYYRRKEEAHFSFLVISMAVLTWFISDMMRNAWVGGGVSNPVFLFIQSYVGANPTDVAALFVGVYFGMSSILLFDLKKRMQAVVLILAGLLVLLWMWTTGTILAYWDGASYGLLLFGGVLGVMTGGRTLFNIRIRDPRRYRRIISSGGTDPLSFRYTNILVVLLIVGSVVIAFLEAHIRYEALLSGTASTIGSTIVGVEELPKDILSSILLISVVFLFFLKYEASRSLFILGESRSGKTHFTLALHQEATRQNRIIRGNPNIESLQSALSDSWVPATERQHIDELEFQFEHGDIFRKLVTVNMVDYPGEFLKFLPDGLEYLNGNIDRSDVVRQIQGEYRYDGSRPDESTENAVTDGGHEEDIDSEESTDPSAFSVEGQLDEDDEEGIDEISESSEPEADTSETTQDQADGPDEEINAENILANLETTVLEKLDQSDTLIFTLDGEEFKKYAEGEDHRDLGIDHFLNVVDSKDNPRIFAVMTKSDYYKNAFESQTKMAATSRNYEDFKNFINQRVNATDNGERLTSRSGTIYPVFIREDEHGEPATGSGYTRRLQTLGYHRVLQILGR